MRERFFGGLGGSEESGSGTLMCTVVKLARDRSGGDEGQVLAVQAKACATKAYATKRHSFP